MINTESSCFFPFVPYSTNFLAYRNLVWIIVPPHSSRRHQWKSKSGQMLAYFFHFNLRLLLTTLTLLNAIAAPAIMGFSKKPFIG